MALGATRDIFFLLIFEFEFPLTRRITKSIDCCLHFYSKTDASSFSTPVHSLLFTLLRGIVGKARFAVLWKNYSLEHNIVLNRIV